VRGPLTTLEGRFIRGTSSLSCACCKLEDLHDTAIAFSGRDSVVFVPISALARAFKVLESLASYLLFGIAVSRAATAAGSRLSAPVWHTTGATPVGSLRAASRRIHHRFSNDR
jgi:hypothetical protein